MCGLSSLELILGERHRHTQVAGISQEGGEGGRKGREGRRKREEERWKGKKRRKKGGR